jgi:hypothetical protein
MDKIKIVSNIFSGIINKFLGFLENHDVISDKTKQNIKKKINPNKRIFYILLVMMVIYFLLSVINSLFSFPVILIVSVLVGTYVSSSSSLSSS